MIKEYIKEKYSENSLEPFLSQQILSDKRKKLQNGKIMSDHACNKGLVSGMFKPCNSTRKETNSPIKKQKSQQIFPPRRNEMANKYSRRH